MKPQTAQEFVNELNQEEGYSFKQCKQFISELEKDLAIAEAKPKEINEDAAAVAKALANYDPNAPKNTAATFDYKTYLATDAKARELFSSYLINKGYIINSNEENYGVDIIASKNNDKALFELEISSQHFTSAETFNYENVHFLARKKKMLTNEGDYHYIILNAAGTYAMTAMASKIFKEENKITKYAGNGRDGMDEFYQLPKNEVKFFKISLT